MRCFLAIRLPEGAKQALISAQQRIEEGAEGFYSFTREESMHLTLYFLGDMEEEPLAEAKDALSHLKAEPFDIRIEGLEILPETTSPRVLAGGIRGDTEQLRRFQQRVSDTILQLAAFKEMRRYYPHVTIGKIKRGMPSNAKAVKRTLAALKIAPTESWTVDQFELIQSTPDKEGPKYETLETYKLG